MIKGDPRNDPTLSRSSHHQQKLSRIPQVQPIMMSTRILFLLFTVFVFAMLTTATPVPAEDSLVKKSLKQLKLKRGDTAWRTQPDHPHASPKVGKRDGPHQPKPSSRPNEKHDWP